MLANREVTQVGPTLPNVTRVNRFHCAAVASLVNQMVQQTVHISM